MLFTSFTFALFLTTLFIFYWFVFRGKLYLQNFLLLAAGYLFYGWWDLRFLVLLIIISASNYVLSLAIENNDKQKTRKIYFVAGLTINLGTLVIFKYFNFFIDGILDLILIFGLKANPITISFFVPIGISFYIFLSLSYLIDVYRQNLRAEKNFPEAMLALSFFPIILAGPIHRPKILLPQIKSERIFSYDKATDGLKQMLWGIFMKSVIADNCSTYVDFIFANQGEYNGTTLIAGIFLFTIQIYADFAGYSNIAIGIGKLFGFDIIRNFASPYFSRDISEFWKKWNISLTTWFRDYVFFPIAFSLTRKIKLITLFRIKKELLIYTIGITITWLLTGFWHGPNFTFIVWGLVHGFFLVLHHASIKPRRRLLKYLGIKNKNKILVFCESVFTFLIIMFSWIFFKADSLNHAFSYVLNIFSTPLLTLPAFRPKTPILILIILFFVLEWFGRRDEYAIQNFFSKSPKVFRWTMYYAVIIVILIFAITSQKFIYFQF